MDTEGIIVTGCNYADMCQGDRRYLQLLRHVYNVMTLFGVVF
jgi:hypothetical protein